MCVCHRMQRVFRGVGCVAEELRQRKGALCQALSCIHFETETTESVGGGGGGNGLATHSEPAKCFRIGRQRACCCGRWRQLGGGGWRRLLCSHSSSSSSCGGCRIGGLRQMIRHTSLQPASACGLNDASWSHQLRGGVGIRQRCACVDRAACFPFALPSKTARDTKPSSELLLLLQLIQQLTVIRREMRE